MFFVDFVVCRYSTSPIFEFSVFALLNCKIFPLQLEVKVSTGYFLTPWTVLGIICTCKNFVTPQAISNGLLPLVSSLVVYYTIMIVDFDF